MILADTVKTFLNVLVAFRFMFMGHRDGSPHMYRCCGIGLTAGWLNKALMWSGTPALMIFGPLLHFTYLGSILIGYPLSVSRSCFCAACVRDGPSCVPSSL